MAPIVASKKPRVRRRREAEQAPPVGETTIPVEFAGDPAQKHPDLADMIPIYRRVRDTRRGSDAVKLAAQEYLPMPGGFRAQADQGTALYDAYMKRAQVPDIMNPTVLGMVGIIHRVEATIEGLDEGSSLAPLWESATSDGLPLEMLHRRVTEELLTTARVGLFVDMAEGGADLPHIALYTAESVVNWSDEADFFVLEESYRIRDGFSWRDAKRYRILTIDAEGNYRVVVRHINDPSAVDTIYEPTGLGGKRPETIPFTVAGAIDLSLDVEQPPLLGVADSSLAIYRLDADYRHQLFMSGQETLVFSGLNVDDVPEYVGSGLAIALPLEGRAEYVGPKGVGISAHKEAIADEREVAAAAGARVFDSGQRGAESGDALRIRARASTATLVSIAISSAMLLEKTLRHCATLVGMDPSKVIVKPNLDFVDSPLSPSEALALVKLWQAKAISYETLYERLQRGEIASFERTAEDELQRMLDEELEGNEPPPDQTEPPSVEDDVDPEAEQ